MFIYKITNTENGKIYIGLDCGSQDDSLRWKYHLHYYNKRNIKEYEKALYRAMRKYGTESFLYEIIDSATNKEELEEKEIHWISYYNSFLGEGYNCTPGGESGRAFINYWSGLTTKEKKNIRKKAGIGISKAYRILSDEEKTRRATERRQRNIEFWKNISEEDRKLFSETISTHNKKVWKNRNKDINDFLRNMIIAAGKTFWEEATDEERKNHSANSKSGWTNMSEEKKAAWLIKNRKQASKQWKCISADGTEFIVSHLPSFCQDNNLSYNVMWNIANGRCPEGKTHKGWICIKLSK